MVVSQLENQFAELRRSELARHRCSSSEASTHSDASSSRRRANTAMPLQQPQVAMVLGTPIGSGQPAAQPAPPPPPPAADPAVLLPEMLECCSLAEQVLGGLDGALSLMAQSLMLIVAAGSSGGEEQLLLQDLKLRCSKYQQQVTGCLWLPLHFLMRVAGAWAARDLRRAVTGRLTRCERQPHTATYTTSDAGVVTSAPNWV